MPDSIVDEAETERILAMDKRIVEQNQWRQDPNRNYLMEVPVEASEELPLRMYGRYNPRTAMYTFVLLLSQQVLCRLDVGKGHRNPDRDNVGRVHKHRWTDHFRDKWAYAPPDIDPNAGFQAVFQSFCKECRISVEARFFEPPGYGQSRLI